MPGGGEQDLGILEVGQLSKPSTFFYLAHPWLRPWVSLDQEFLVWCLLPPTLHFVRAKPS